MFLVYRTSVITVPIFYATDVPLLIIKHIRPVRHVFHIINDRNNIKQSYVLGIIYYYDYYSNSWHNQALL